MRLFGKLYPQHSSGKRVESLRLRIQAVVPGGATVQVTDVQLQPGSFITGWTLHSADLGLEAVGGWELRNGIMRGPQTMVITSDTEQASPLRVDAQPLNGAAAVRVGRYLFGTIADAARVDGLGHTASQGAGLPPYLTARADVDVPIDQPATTRSRVLVWLRGITQVTDDTVATETDEPEEPIDPGTEPEPEDEPGTPDPNDPPDDDEDEEEP